MEKLLTDLVEGDKVFDLVHGWGKIVRKGYNARRGITIYVLFPNYDPLVEFNSAGQRSDGIATLYPFEVTVKVEKKLNLVKKSIPVNISINKKDGSAIAASNSDFNAEDGFKYFRGTLTFEEYE